MTKRVCCICKSELSGRIDKIFCSVRCKNQYHIKLRAVTKAKAQSIDGILHRNRSILLELLGKNLMKKKVPRQLLDKKKFNYKYITHFHINSRNKMVRYVYDFGWLEFSEDSILILRT